MARFNEIGAATIEDLVACDACDSKQIMQLQNLVGRTDDFQDCVDAYLRELKGQEDVLEDQNAEAGHVD